MLWESLRGRKIPSRFQTSKRDANTFLRISQEAKPLLLIKGVASDYDAAWEYLYSIYGDLRVMSDTIKRDIVKSVRPIRETHDVVIWCT